MNFKVNDWVQVREDYMLGDKHHFLAGKIGVVTRIDSPKIVELYVGGYYEHAPVEELRLLERKEREGAKIVKLKEDNVGFADPDPAVNIAWFKRRYDNIDTIIVNRHSAQRRKTHEVYETVATVVKLKDGRKGIVRKREGEAHDVDKGILYAYVKAMHTRKPDVRVSFSTKQGVNPFYVRRVDPMVALAEELNRKGKPFHYSSVPPSMQGRPPRDLGIVVDDERDSHDFLSGLCEK